MLRDSNRYELLADRDLFSNAAYDGHWSSLYAPLPGFRSDSWLNGAIFLRGAAQFRRWISIGGIPYEQPVLRASLCVFDVHAENRALAEIRRDLSERDERAAPDRMDSERSAAAAATRDFTDARDALAEIGVEERRLRLSALMTMNSRTLLRMNAMRYLGRRVSFRARSPAPRKRDARASPASRSQRKRQRPRDFEYAAAAAAPSARSAAAARSIPVPVSARAAPSDTESDSDSGDLVIPAHESDDDILELRDADLRSVQRALGTFSFQPRAPCLAHASLGDEDPLAALSCTCSLSAPRLLFSVSERAPGRSGGNLIIREPAWAHGGVPLIASPFLGGVRFFRLQAEPERSQYVSIVSEANSAPPVEAHGAALAPYESDVNDSFCATFSPDNLQCCVGCMDSTVILYQPAC
jgi:hypothetical protein